MQSIQEIFHGDFASAKLAVLQKMAPSESNLRAREASYTEHWPKLVQTPQVLVLSIGEKQSKRREIWAGALTDIHPSDKYDGLFRFYVDRFNFIGEHDLDAVTDANFYGNGGGGGARVYATNGSLKGRTTSPYPSLSLDSQIPEGAMERRLVWVRKNHRAFRDPVHRHWDAECAVTGNNCDGLLVASHIHPWAKCTPKEKTDPHNGLLLSVPIDSLFDRGFIAFANSGKMLIKPFLTDEMLAVFGLARERGAHLKRKKITPQMRTYLQRHREFHGFV